MLARFQRAPSSVGRSGGPVTQQVRWSHLKNYVIHTTAKVDYNFNTWMNEYAFDDLPYTRRDIFFFNETPVRQHRIIEAKIITRLKKEDKIPETLLPLVNDIFVSPKEEEARLNELYWKITELYRREHPRYLEEIPYELPVDRGTYWGLSQRIRDAVRLHNLKARAQVKGGEILFGDMAADALLQTVRAEYTEASSGITDADFQAVAVAAAIEGAGGPKVLVRFGRQAPFAPQYPDPSKEQAAAIRKSLPGFSDSEIAAICAVNSMRTGGFSRAYLSTAMTTAGNALCDDAGLKKATSAFAGDLELLRAEFPTSFAKFMELGEEQLWEAPETAQVTGTCGFLNGSYDNGMVGLHS